MEIKTSADISGPWRSCSTILTSENFGNVKAVLGRNILKMTADAWIFYKRYLSFNLSFTSFKIPENHVRSTAATSISSWRCGTFYRCLKNLDDDVDIDFEPYEDIVDARSATRFVESLKTLSFRRQSRWIFGKSHFREFTDFRWNCAGNILGDVRTENVKIDHAVEEWDIFQIHVTNIDTCVNHGQSYFSRINYVPICTARNRILKSARIKGERNRVEKDNCSLETKAR